MQVYAIELAKDRHDDPTWGLLRFIFHIEFSAKSMAGPVHGKSLGITPGPIMALGPWRRVIRSRSDLRGRNVAGQCIEHYKVSYE